MRRACLLAVAVAVLLPSRARAEWVVGTAAAYAFPLGTEMTGIAMRDVVSGQFPLQLEAGYRYIRLTLGAYVSYGFGSVAGQLKDFCSAAGQSCSSRSLRFGGQISYSFADRTETWQPWIGVGTGWESVTVSRFTDQTMTGSEWLMLQGGLDRLVAPSTTVGVFARASVGMFTDANGGSQPGVIQDRGFHEWLTLGIRGTFSFGR